MQFPLPTQVYIIFHKELELLTPEEFDSIRNFARAWYLEFGLPESETFVNLNKKQEEKGNMYEEIEEFLKTVDMEDFLDEYFTEHDLEEEL